MLAQMPETEGLTRRQRLVLRCIQDSVVDRGYPPSMREIADRVGLTSASSVSYQLSILERKGFIRRDPNLPRAIELTTAVDRTTDSGDLRPEPVYVPVLGRIAAGNPILAEESVEDVFPMPRQLVGAGGEHFMLKVIGDSMVEAAICEGDWVLVRKQPTVENGEICAALMHGEATVKTFQRKDGEVWLLPQNQHFRPIKGDRVEILGLVVAVIRKV